ncbi:lectin [Paenibacillus elgii]|nr:lectin [Paenibacillus elgii]
MRKMFVLLSVVCMLFLFSVPSFAAAGQNFLSEGQSLAKGQWLQSNNGQYTLILQDDGNLVLYGRGKALWDSKTNGLAAKELVMQSDGNLVLYGYPGVLWSSNTHGYPGSSLFVQDDGNVVIYIGRLAIWSTGTN